MFGKTKEFEIVVGDSDLIRNCGIRGGLVEVSRSLYVSGKEGENGLRREFSIPERVSRRAGVRGQLKQGTQVVLRRKASEGAQSGKKIVRIRVVR